MRLPNHKTKIVCTIGPACRSRPVLEKMIMNGMNVARLNFSHGSLEEHGEDIGRIRSVAAALGRPVAILADLPGPKIRLGTLRDEPLVLKKGEVVTLVTGETRNSGTKIPVDYPELPQSVSAGGTIYVNDGFVQLKVLEVLQEGVRCRVVIGGTLVSRKGINLPGRELSVKPVSEKDLELLDFGITQGLDTFSISFVGEARDILEAKEFANRRGTEIRVVAKIEREQAVRHIDEILGVADAVMIARGDLGVEIPLDEVPAVQKKIIRKANLLGRPVITATQMLLSMTENTRPTRAEVTDVANAILDGTDAVMLSEETAVGRYPAETVRMMARIASSIERQRHSFQPSLRTNDYGKAIPMPDDMSEIIALTAVEAARSLNARFLLTPTHSGATARRVCSFRPDHWILAFSKDKAACEFLAFSRGVYPFLLKPENESWHDALIAFLKEAGLARAGDLCVLTEGRFSVSHRVTDSLSIFTVA